MKQTSANMQPCKGGTAEQHNERKKELDYVRKDLTRFNHYKKWISIEDEMVKIREEYEKATGQKLQVTAAPIQEIVLVIDQTTTPEQVENFCALIRNLGMTPLSYAIHKDEGHTDVATGEWTPNYHAHIVVDTTCWEHKLVERTRKKNGKNVINPKTHKPEKIFVDGYAKTIKFTREDMAKLQDYAAEATGLDRGVSSDRIHEDARRFKALEQAREIERQANKIEEQKSKVAVLEAELAEKQSLSARQSEVISNQKALLAAQEQIMRNSVVEMQHQGAAVVKSYDEQNTKLVQYGIVPEKGLRDRRDWLEQTSRDSFEEAPIHRIIQLLQPLANAITVVAMANAAMATTLANTLANTIQEKEKMLAALMRHIKEQSVWKSTKGALLSLVDKPANKQAKALMAEVAAANTMVDEEKNKTAEMAKRITSLEKTALSLRKAVSQKETLIECYCESVSEANSENDSLRAKLADLEKQLETSTALNSRLRQRIANIAAVIVDHSSPTLVSYWEKMGLPKCVGELMWGEVKATSEERKAKFAERRRQAQEQKELQEKRDVTPTVHKNNQKMNTLHHL